MDTPLYDIGMIGLGVMGRNFALNIADHGFKVIGYDKDPSKIQALQTEAESRPAQGVASIETFVKSLKKPRVVFMLVPAGPPVNSVVRDTLPYLEPGDIIIDGGNSYYKDTALRQKTLAAKGFVFMGIGISGGESGARHGPCLMPGGSKEAYEHVRPILEAAAAKVDGDPCVTYLGPGAAGHYVKMVHNGLEYGWMELIAESYDFMKRKLGFSDDQLQAVFREWNQTELNSYLIEISANIFGKIDPVTGKCLVDVILDEAKQKGTGKWASQDAMDLQVPVPTIDTAVSMRDISAHLDERTRISQVLAGPQASRNGIENPDTAVAMLKNSLYAGMVLTMVQGMNLLRAASVEYSFQLDLEAVARIWRGGCIIRAAMLEKVREAYRAQPDLPNLLMDPGLGKVVVTRQADLRHLVGEMASVGLPGSGFMVSLGYFDAYRSANLPANLIQAQRDYFGAHTYERVDEKGVFHTRWEE